MTIAKDSHSKERSEQQLGYTAPVLELSLNSSHCLEITPWTSTVLKNGLTKVKRLHIVTMVQKEQLQPSKCLCVLQYFLSEHVQVYKSIYKFLSN